MAGGSKEYQLKVTLGLNAAISQAESLKKILASSVKTNTSDYNNISQVIDKISKSAEKMRDKMQDAFKTSSGTRAFMKEYEQLSSMLEAVQQRFGNVKFDNLLMSNADTETVKSITKEMSTLESQIDAIKKNKISDLFDSGTGDVFDRIRESIHALGDDTSKITFDALINNLHSSASTAEKEFTALKEQIESVDKLTASFGGKDGMGKITEALRKSAEGKDLISRSITDPKEIAKINSELQKYYGLISSQGVNVPKKTTVNKEISSVDFIKSETEKIESAYQNQINTITDKKDKVTEALNNISKAHSEKALASGSASLNKEKMEQILNSDYLKNALSAIGKGLDDYNGLNIQQKFNAIKADLKSGLSSLFDTDTLEEGKAQVRSQLESMFDGLGEQVIAKGKLTEFRESIQNVLGQYSLSLKDIGLDEKEITAGQGIAEVYNNVAAALQKYIEAEQQKSKEMQDAGKLEQLKKAYEDFSAAVEQAQKTQASSGDVITGKSGQLDEYKNKLLAITQVYAQMMGKNVGDILNLDSLKQGTQAMEGYLSGLIKLENRQKNLSNVQMAISRWMGFYQVLNLTKRAVNSMKQHITELDTVMTKIAVVTNMSQDNLWGQIGQYSEMARQYGVAIKGVYEVSQLYYQQGLQKGDVMNLTQETLKMARIAGIEYSTAADYMTTAIRGFKLEMSDASHVTDVFSNLAANTASSTEELAVAISKTAASAASVGSSFESTSAMMATMISTTRESATNIGTALKSIISRYGEMKENMTGIDTEGEEYSLNKVDKALQAVGITLHDTSGQFRDFDDVILELAEAWDSIDKNTQRYIATVMAGNRQQSRFLSLVSNVDEYKRALEIANDAEGTGEVQTLKTLDSIDAKVERLKVTIQEFYTSSGIQDMYKGILDTITNIISSANDMPKVFDKIPAAALSIGVQVVSAIKSVLTLVVASISQTMSELRGQSVSWLTGLSNSIREHVSQGMREGAKEGSTAITQETKKTLGSGAAVQMIGAGMKVAGSVMTLTAMNQYAQSKKQEDDRSAGLLMGGGAAAGVLGSAVSGFAFGGPLGALISGLLGIVTNLGSITSAFEMLTPSLKREYELSSKNLSEARQQEAIDKGTVKEYETAYDKFKSLEEASNSSSEAMQEFINYQNQLAESYPGLVDGLSDAGDSIISLTKLEQALAQARATSAQSIIDSTEAEIENQKDKQKIYQQLYLGTENITASYNENNMQRILHDVTGGKSRGTDQEQVQAFLSWANNAFPTKEFAHADLAVKDQRMAKKFKEIYAPYFDAFYNAYISDENIVSQLSEDTKTRVFGGVDKEIKSKYKAVLKAAHENSNGELGYAELTGNTELKDLSEIDNWTNEDVIRAIQYTNDHAAQWSKTLVGNIQSLDKLLLQETVDLKVQSEINTYNGAQAETLNQHSSFLSSMLRRQYKDKDREWWNTTDGYEAVSAGIKEWNQWLIGNEENAEWLAKEFDFGQISSKTGGIDEITQVLKDHGIFDQGIIDSYIEDYTEYVSTLGKSYNAAVDKYLKFDETGLSTQQIAQFTGLYNGKGTELTGQLTKQVQGQLQQYKKLSLKDQTIDAANYAESVLDFYSSVAELSTDAEKNEVAKIIDGIDFSDSEGLSETADSLREAGYDELATKLDKAQQKLGINVAARAQNLSESLKETIKDIEGVTEKVNKGMKYSDALESAKKIIERAGKDAEGIALSGEKGLIDYDTSIGEYVLTTNGISTWINALQKEQADDIATLERSNQQQAALFDFIKSSPIESIKPGDTATIEAWAKGMTGRGGLQKQLADTEYALTEEEAKGYAGMAQRLVQEFQEQAKSDSSLTWEKFIESKQKLLKESGLVDMEILKSATKNSILSQISSFDFSSIATGRAGKYTKGNLKALLQAAGVKLTDEKGFDLFEPMYKQLLSGNFDLLDRMLQDVGGGLSDSIMDSTHQGIVSSYQAAIEQLTDPENNVITRETEALIEQIKTIHPELKDADTATIVAQMQADMQNFVAWGWASLAQYNNSLLQTAKQAQRNAGIGKTEAVFDALKDGFTLDELNTLQQDWGIKLFKENGEIVDELAEYFTQDPDTGKWQVTAGKTIAQAFDAVGKLFGLSMFTQSKAYKDAASETVKQQIEDMDSADTEKQMANTLSTLAGAKVGTRIDVSAFSDEWKTALGVDGDIYEVMSEVQRDAFIASIDATKITDAELKNMVMDLQEQLVTKRPSKSEAYSGIMSERVSRDAAKTLSQAVYGDEHHIEALMEDVLGFTWDDITQQFIAGDRTFDMIQQMVDSLPDTTQQDHETKNNLQGLLNSAKELVANKSNDIIRQLLDNYSNIDNQMIADFNTQWVQTGIQLENYITTDAVTGVKKLDVEGLTAAFAQVGIDINAMFGEQIANIVDTYLDNINKAVSYTTEGTTSQAEMQAFIKSAQEFGIDASEAFQYDTILKAWTLDSDVLTAYVQKQAQQLVDQGKLAQNDVTDYVNTQVGQKLAEAIDIQSYLESEDKTGEARKKLTRQIVNSRLRKRGTQLASENYEDYMDEAGAEFGRRRVGTSAEDIKRRAKAMARAAKDNNDKILEQQADDLINQIDEGGEQAVQVMQVIARAQGKELTSANIESAYRAQVSQIENSFEQLITGPGGIVTGTAKTILETLQSQGKASITALDANNAVVNSITDIAAAYQEYYNLLAQSGEATLESLNSAYAKVLETRQERAQEQQAIDALSDASGMTFETLGTIFSEAGINLEQYADELESSGIIESLGGNKVRIKDFAAFARRMNWDFNSEEYLSAFSSFNDGLIESNKKNKESVNNELQNLKDARPGDWLNLTQTEKAFKSYSKNIKINTEKLQANGMNLFDAWDQAVENAETNSFFNEIQTNLLQYGAVLSDGILKLSEDANLLGIAETLKNAAIESGSEMSADLADMVDSIVNAYTDAITKGIEGGLTNTEKQDLRRKSSDLGIELTNEDFINAAEGFQLTTDKAIELYTRMGRLDTRQQKKIYKVLSQQLKDSNSQYKTATSMLSHIAEMQEEINKLRDRGNDKDKKHIESLERELKLAKEMQMYALTHEDQSWNFMSNDAIPDSIDNALNYFQNWGQASKSLGEWSLSGKTDLNQFAALLQHVQEVADATGEAVDFMGVKVGKNATTYEDFLDNLYDMAEYNAQSGQWELNNTKMQQKLGFNMKLGSKGISTDLQTRIDQYADMNAQVLQDFDEFTGGLAAVYDTLHDYSEDNLGHSFEDFLVNQGLDTEYFDYNKFKSQLGKNEKAMKAFEAFTKKVKVDGQEWDAAMASGNFKKGSENYNALMAVMKMALSENWDLESDYQAVAEQLEQSGFTGEVTLGDITIVASEGRTIIKKKGSNGEDIFIGPDGTEYKTENEVIDAINRKALEDYQKSFEKYFKEGSDNNTIEIAGEEITVVIGKGKVTFKNSNGDVISEGASMEEATKKAQQGMAKTNKLAGTATEEGWAASQTTEYKNARNFTDTGILTAQAREIGQARGLLTANAISEAYNTAIRNVAQKNNAQHLTNEGIINQFGEAVAAEFYSGTGIKLDANNLPVTIEGNLANQIEQQMNLTQTAADVMNGINAALSNPTTQTELGKAISGAFEAVTTDGVPAGEITINPTSVTVNTEGVQPEAVKDMTIPGGTITIVPTNTVVDAAAGAEAAEGGNQITITGTVNYDNEFTKETPPEQTGGTAKYDKNQFTKETPPTLTGGTAVYTPTVEGSLPTLSGGVARYTAIIQGTKATGNVGLATGNAHAKSTLMGELGPEMVVSNGRYFVVGQNGPEFVDLANDAIVFNHLQTQSLLEKGSSKTRGKAITNERAAVSYAHGTGIALDTGRGNVRDAHNKYNGSSPVWNNGTDAIFNGVAKAGQAAEEALDAFIKKLDEWYNQLQEIAKIEEKITYQETLRSKIESDLTKNGKAYYESQKTTINDLERDIVQNQALAMQQQDYLNKRVQTLNSENSPWSKLYTIDSEGQVKYKDGMKEMFGEKFGATDANKPNYTPQEQYNWLISQGFGEFLKYDSNGKEIEFTDKEGKENQAAYKTAVESFWKTMEDELTEVQDLKDSIDEHQKAVLEAQQKQNELIAEMRDNQIELEEKVLNAIVDTREREIDELENVRDAYSESADKLVNGLTDALNKERDMYQMQDDQAETDKMRRRLAILQSSGGSASEIIDLEEQIRQRDRDMYFEEQQRQIDAIKEASDKELERLDYQIDLQKELLDYQKEHGLLWTEVYNVMEKSPEDISNFIMQNTKEFWGNSMAKNAETADDLVFSATKWTGFREDMKKDLTDPFKNLVNSILTNNGKKEWENYVAALKETYGEDFSKDTELYEAYMAKYKETSDPNQAAAAVKAILDKRGTKTATEKAAEAEVQETASNVGGSISFQKANNGSNNTYSYSYIDAEGAVHVRGGFKSQEEAIAAAKKSIEDAAKIDPNKSTSGYQDNEAQKIKDTISVTTNQKNTNKGKAAVNMQSIGTTSTGETVSNAGSYYMKKYTGKVTGNAFAKGTLLGELGPEAWIANGKFHIAGQNGAEMVNLPNDAIVFNHQQTERLLRTGKAGRGNAINGEDAALGNKERNSYISTFWDQVARNRASMESINYPSYATSSSLERINNELQNNNNTNEAITIEHAEVNMNVEQLANDYDARRAGEQALQEMLRIARKGSVTTVRR